MLLSSFSTHLIFDTFWIMLLPVSFLLSAVSVCLIYLELVCIARYLYLFSIRLRRKVFNLLSWATFLVLTCSCMTPLLTYFPPEVRVRRVVLTSFLMVNLGRPCLTLTRYDSEDTELFSIVVMSTSRLYWNNHPHTSRDLERTQHRHIHSSLGM